MVAGPIVERMSANAVKASGEVPGSALNSPIANTIIHSSDNPAFSQCTTEQMANAVNANSIRLPSVAAHGDAKRQVIGAKAQGNTEVMGH